MPPGEADAVAQGVGVAEGGDGRAQFGGVGGIELAVDQQGVPAPQQARLQQGGHGPELPRAAVAVVAQGQIALPRLPGGLHGDAEHPFGGIAAQPGQGAPHALDSRLPLEQLQLQLHGGQPQDLAPQGAQQPADTTVQPGVAAGDLDADHPAFHHIEIARCRVAHHIDAAADVPVEDEPGAQGHGAGLEPLVGSSDPAAFGQDRQHLLGAVERQPADLRQGGRCPGGGGLGGRFRGGGASAAVGLGGGSVQGADVDRRGRLRLGGEGRSSWRGGPGRRIGPSCRGGATSWARRRSMQGGPSSRSERQAGNLVMDR